MSAEVLIQQWDLLAEHKMDAGGRG